MRNNQKIPDESDINEAENIINTPSDDTFLDIKDELKNYFIILQHLFLQRELR